MYIDIRDFLSSKWCSYSQNEFPKSTVLLIFLFSVKLFFKKYFLSFFSSVKIFQKHLSSLSMHASQTRHLQNVIACNDTLIITFTLHCFKHSIHYVIIFFQRYMCVCICNVSAEITWFYYSPSSQQPTKCDISPHLMFSVAERKLLLAFLRRYHGCHILVLTAQKIQYFPLLLCWLRTCEG